MFYENCLWVILGISRDLFVTDDESLLRRRTLLYVSYLGQDKFEDLKTVSLLNVCLMVNSPPANISSKFLKKYFKEIIRNDLKSQENQWKFNHAGSSGQITTA